MEPLLSPHPYPCRQIRATVISRNLPIYLVSTLGPHAFSAQQPERSFSFVNQVLVVLAQGLGVKCTLMCWLLWTLRFLFTTLSHPVLHPVSLCPPTSGHNFLCVPRPLHRPHAQLNAVDSYPLLGVSCPQLLLAEISSQMSWGEENIPHFPFRA